MNVTIIGTGYVGLVTGLGLAAAGHTVLGVDSRPEVVERLNAGRPHIYEDGVSEALERMLLARRIRFAEPDVEQIAATDVVLIAVGTPSTADGIDLAQVRSAVELAAHALRRSATPMSVIMKSTVVPGTTRELVPRVIRETTGMEPDEYGLGMTPEFLREGSALADFSTPDRLVLGYENERGLDALRELFARFEAPRLEVNTSTAELIKYANNLFLALQISASNEIAAVASSLGDVDPRVVMQGVLADHRWSGAPQPGKAAPPIERYLVPGPGFGGSCFPKDVQAIREFGRQLGVPMAMATAILEVNRRQPRASLDAMLDGLDAIAGAEALVLGLAFKPGTDDVRETPAAEIVRGLLDRAASVRVHDPMAARTFTEAFGPSVRVAERWEEAARTADVVVVVTPWREYVRLPEFVGGGAIVLDPRRAFEPEWFAVGVRYRSIGVRAP
ncbi:UDP-glucose dehydrogenase family protein [Agromyces lapidis]|uniref:UDP-glucose 6-dehydrogenase n=1 Tax=Agromyces lapidis TaxID=279574 RepID=A0ABV5SM32_9MICO|nr:nucleotide sugar dehydrogenase [Agromyces lapidis]